MRVIFFFFFKFWVVGSVKKLDCDFWGLGMIDLDWFLVIK